MRKTDLSSVTLPLWLTYAIIPLAAGADKFFNLLVDWSQYIAPVFEGLIPFSNETFMLIVGVIEIAVGVAALTRLRRLAAYVASVWLVLIAVNLIAAGYYDIAVRDLALAAGAFALGQLLAVQGEAVFGGRSHSAAIGAPLAA